MTVLRKALAGLRSAENGTTSVCILGALAAIAFAAVLPLGRDPSFRARLLEWSNGGWYDAALDGAYPAARSFRALLECLGSLALAGPFLLLFSRRRRTAKTESSSAAEAALLASALLLGILLRLDLWWTKSFWIDTYRLKASIRCHSFAELLSLPLGFGQSAPVGLCLAERAVGILTGWSDRGLTLPILLAGLATLALVPIAVSRAGAPRFRAPATLLVAASPQLVYYSAEFKQYGVDALFATLSLLAAIDIGRGRRPRALLATVFILGPLLSHTQFLVLPGLGLLLLLASVRRDGAWRRPARADALLLLLCGGLGGLATLASYAHTVATMPGLMSGFWASAFPPRGSAGAFCGWWAEKALMFFRDPFSILPVPPTVSWPLLPLFLPVLAILALGSLSRNRGARSAAFVLGAASALLVLASTLGKWPVRTGTGSAIESRHLLFLLPGAFLLLAVGLDRIRSRCLPLACAAVIASLGTEVSRVLTDRIYSWSLPDALAELARRAPGDEPILLGDYHRDVAIAYAPEWLAANEDRIEGHGALERLAEEPDGFWALWVPRGVEGRVFPERLAGRIPLRRADFAKETAAGILRHFPGPRTSVRFALCQTDAAAPAGADPVSAALSVAADAVSNGADVVVLPELSFLSFARLASERSFPPPAEEADVRARLAAFAASNGVYLLANAPRTLAGDGTSRANESLLFGPAGETVAAYRKRCMARSDGVIGFLKGNESAVVELPFARIGLLVCKDATRPDLFRDDYAGCDLLVAQFAHPALPDGDRPEAEWCETEEEAAGAFETIAGDWGDVCPKPMLFVNKAGTDGPFRFLGGSRAVDAFGNVAGSLGGEPGTLYVDFPLDGSERLVPAPSPVPSMRPEPVPAGEEPGPTSVRGRRVDWFRHRMVPAWNSPDPGSVRVFAVVHPAPWKDGPGAPLVLALHSHGYDAARLVRSLSEPGDHDVWKTPDDCFVLVPDCSPRPPEDAPEFWWCCANHAEAPGREEAARSGRTPPARRCSCRGVPRPRRRPTSTPGWSARSGASSPCSARTRSFRRGTGSGPACGTGPRPSSSTTGPTTSCRSMRPTGETCPACSDGRSPSLPSPWPSRGASGKRRWPASPSPGTG